jgi:hypothetical protein
MGRAEAQVDMSYLEDLLMEQVPRKEICRAIGVSAPTLRKIIANAEDKRTLLDQYKTLRNLHLTEIEVAVLQAISPDKIESASLKELMYAYKVLRSKEYDEQQEGKDDIKGLVAHLLHLERLERDMGRPLSPSDIQEAEYEEVASSNPDNLPDLPDPILR